MKRILGLALCAGLVFSTIAQAESLKDKKAIKEAEERITGDALKDANEKCGTKFKVNVDWTSFSKAYKDSYQHMSAALYCGTVLDGIRYVCEAGADEKAAVAKSVKEVKCSYKKEAAKLAADKKGNTLHASYNWETGNIADDTKEWLMNKL